MNYENYEKKIIECHSVILEGWPLDKIRNPGKVGGCKELTVLLDAIQSSKCCWKRLTEDELDKKITRNQEHEAAGEEV
jgi:hypothetical protein